MLLEAIRTLYAYHHQAMGRLLSVAHHAGDGLGQEVVRGQPAPLNTFVHLCGSQRIHVDWWSGAMSGSDSFRRHFTVADYPDLPSVEALWAGVERDTTEFLGTLDDQELARVCARPLHGGGVKERPLWLSMLHIANHGTQHRSEVAMMLTVLGHSPGDMELV